MHRFIRRLLGYWIPYAEVICEYPPSTVVHYSPAFLRRAMGQCELMRLGKKSFGSLLQDNIRKEIGWPVKRPPIRFYRYGDSMSGGE